MNQRSLVLLKNILILMFLAGTLVRFPWVVAWAKSEMVPIAGSLVSSESDFPQPDFSEPDSGARGQRIDLSQAIGVVNDAPSRLDYQEAERLLNQLTTLIFIVGSFLGLVISLLLDKTIRDNQRLRVATQELERLANLDGLTQIANRRTFESHLQQEWARAMRDKSSLTLILCDVDHFRLYNETYGHQAGDDCLRQLALILDRTAKRPGDLAARYGGEEFAIILPHTHASGGIAVAHSIQEAVAHLPLPEAAATTPVSLSIGLATVVPSQELSAAMLTELGDRALYTAKERGRNQIVCLEPSSGLGDRLAQ
jgi:diguanylate cyclase (GGDEF)-like protein